MSITIGNSVTDPDITQMVYDARAGEGDAIERLHAVIGTKLKEQARRVLRQHRGDPFMQTTVLCNDVFMQVLSIENLQIVNRQHLYALFSTLMTRRFIKRMRERGCQKRGGDVEQRTLNCEAICSVDRDSYIDSADNALFQEAVHEAMEALAREAGEPVRQVVLLRDVWSTSIQDTARILSLSRSSVKRYTLFGRAFIGRNLQQRGFYCAP